MVTTEPPAKATIAYATADLNNLLDTIKTLRTMAHPEVQELTYIRILEEGIEKLKTMAVEKASETPMTHSEMARQLGVSRQTFANTMRGIIRKHQEAKADPKNFTLGEEPRFVDGELSTVAKSLKPTDSRKMDDAERAYYTGFCGMLNQALDAGSKKGVDQIFAKAITDGKINPMALKALRIQAQDFLDEEFDVSESGDPIAETKAEYAQLRLRALQKICGLTDPQKLALAKANRQVAEDDAKELAAIDEHLRGVNVFDGFNLPPVRPAAARLPKNVIEEWRKFQEAEKAAGRKPTPQVFSAKYGVSRSTFARALKRAESQKNAQK